MNDMTARTKVTEGGRIVIPSKLRAAAGIQVGSDVTISLKDGGLEISTRDAMLDRVEGLMRPYIKPGRSVVDQLLKERREEAKKED